MLNQQIKAIKKVYERIDMANSDIFGDIIRGILTTNTARNGRTVIWYQDEFKEAAVYEDTLEALSGEEIASELE